MKKSILVLAGLILFGLNAIAQNTYNLVIFSEEGDGFYAIVNGIRQNDKPETNVKITGLTADALSLRVEFENKALPKLKQNMMGEAGYEHTIRIKTNKKKEVKLQYFGKVALADAPKGSGTTMAYHTSDNGFTNSTGGTQYNTSGNDGGGDNSNTTITTTSTSTRVNSNPNNVSLNVNAGGAGINVNLIGLENPGGNINSTTSTTVTKTTSSSSSSSTSGGGTTKNNSQVNTQAANTGGCSAPISQANFDNMKKSIEDKPFSDTKMSTAKVATKNACLSVAQIKTICSLFSMDDEKLQYAKFAYTSCVEKANYYQVSEIFSFSGTTDDFNKFLESK